MLSGIAAAVGLGKGRLLILAALIVVAVGAMGTAVVTRWLERSWRATAEAETALAKQKRQQVEDALATASAAFDGYMRLVRRSDQAAIEARDATARVDAGAETTIRRVSDEGTDDRAGPGADASQRWLRELVTGIDRADEAAAVGAAPVDVRLPEAGPGATPSGP